MKFSNGVVEILMIKIPIWDLLVCRVYRPPNTNISEWKEVVDMITETLKENQSEKNHNIIISKLSFHSFIFVSGGLYTPHIIKSHI